jgi:transposase
LATRVSYPVEVKMTAIEMRLAGIPVNEVLEQLNIRNKTQLKTWMSWYRKGEIQRLEKPVGKQFSYNKGPEYTSELEKVKAENRFLKQQLDVLKKYKEMERRCHLKLSFHGWSPFITMSMSRKGTPADNALIESFHSPIRIQTKLNNQSPVNFLSCFYNTFLPSQTNFKHFDLCPYKKTFFWIR